MRIGLIADIHGNLHALDAVLAELDRIAVDRIVCLGDVASPGPWPAEVVALLMEREIPCVLGNTDQWLLAETPASVSDTQYMNEINEWAVARLSDAMVDWLRAMPMRRMLRVGPEALACWHGSPRSTMETVSSLTPANALDALLADVDADIVACGHTHVQMLRRTESTTLINPGSVGLGGTGPGTSDLPHPQPVSGAEFAVLEPGTAGVSVCFHHIELDIAAMLEAAGTTGMPHLTAWASLWSS